MMARATTKQAFCIIASVAIRGRVICLPPPSLSSGALGSAAAHMPCAYKTTVLYGFARLFRPAPSRSLRSPSAACAALCSRGCCGWCAHSGDCTFSANLSLYFFCQHHLTRACLCVTIIDAPTEVVAWQHYSITKRRDLSSPVFLFFRRRARGKTPRPPCFWLGRGRSWGLSCRRAVLCGSVVCRASVAVGFWRGAASVVFLPPPASRLYPAVSRVETSARGAPLTRRGRVPLCRSRQKGCYTP